MTFSLIDVDAGAAAMRPFVGADMEALPRVQLVQLLREVGDLKGAVDRLAAEVAGEVARRSTIDDGPAGLARQQGFASPEQLVASVMGAAPHEGHTLVRAGKALAAPGALGEGMRRGLSVAKADLIAQTIARLAGDTGDLEARLVRAGSRMDYRHLKLVCSREAARFDAVQKEELERRQDQVRGLELTEDASGMIHVRGQLPPVPGAILRTFLDAQVKAAFRARRDGPADDRTATQVRADAFVALATHGLDCEAPATGVKATIIVRVNADDLAMDAGLATCDALATPISLSALRQLAIDASVATMIVDSKSHVLDFGREQRLFTWAQRMALAERDGGCAQCHAPISHCIAHHIRWWQRDSGPTDIRNGVLLCVRCHTQIHRDRWEIAVDADNHVWFTPPPEVDPERRRQLGGLAALTT